MIQFHIDNAAGGVVEGWAFTERGAPTVKVVSNNRAFTNASWRERPDVIAVHPSAPLKCGFLVPFEQPAGLSGKIAVHFDTEHGATVSVLDPRYARFLRSVWSHCRFVQDHFPRVNPSSLTARDAYCTLNSPEEMLVIANHLYMLKAAGVAGHFAEFGCFKGYSTCMLSFACAQLGISMHVFDSFDGLPDTESPVYRRGEFKGAFEEVRKHVEVFGCADVVTFHEGFFADSLARFDCPPLMALWMDVDLASSARDVLTVLPRVDSRGAVFSHECPPECFAEGVHQSEDPAHVIPEIKRAYAKAGVPISATHVAGVTGAFWMQPGIPVTPFSELQPHVGI